MKSTVVMLAGALLFAGCGGDPSCVEACDEIISEYENCRDDVNSVESCKSFCDDEAGEKEVMDAWECLDDRDFSCEAFDDEKCQTGIWPAIVVERIRSLSGSALAWLPR